MTVQGWAMEHSSLVLLHWAPSLKRVHSWEFWPMCVEFWKWAPYSRETSVYNTSIWAWSVPGFLDLGTTGIWDWVIPGCRGCAGHFRMSSGIPGHYAPDAGSKLLLLQVLPLWEMNSPPSVKNQGSGQNGEVDSDVCFWCVYPCHFSCPLPSAISLFIHSHCSLNDSYVSGTVRG